MAHIYIEERLSMLESVIPSDRAVYVIIDNNLKHLRSHFSGYNIIEIATSEEKKSLGSIVELERKLLEAGADRDSFIVGVGGGITTDMVGFTAAIYKRGVKFGFVPTTLLAQVDASIGGKNGVNLDSYKNMIGTIVQPEWVYICSEPLTTLPAREFKAGIAEVLKTFILFDAEYYRKAVEYFASLNSDNGYGRVENSPLLSDIIGKCAEYKAQVVARDQFERGERRLLNLGHTFAHAIEKICGDNPTEYEAIMHGEAVSIGMVLAARLALLEGSGSEEFVNMLIADLERVSLPVSLPHSLRTGEKIPMAQLLSAMAKDKKVSGDSIHFILPSGLTVVYDKLLTINKVEELSYALC